MSKTVHFILALLWISVQGLLCGFLVASMTTTFCLVFMIFFGAFVVLGTALLLADILSDLKL